MALFHSRHAPTIRIPAPLHVASSSWLAFARAMLSGSCKHGRISWLRLTAFSILLAACLLLCSCGKAPAKEEAEQPLSIAEPIPGFDAPGPEEGEQTLDITPEQEAAPEQTDASPVISAGPISYTPGLNTIKNFLSTELSVTGHALYIYGGGWNYEDTGASDDARSIGIPASWTEFFEEQDASFDYKDKEKGYYPTEGVNTWYYAGADCSGFLGWAVYNTLYTENGKEGFVVKAADFAKHLADLGLGSYRQKTEFPAYPPEKAVRPGDIVSIKGHVWTALGACSDGSIVILHSSPTESRSGAPGGGVQLGAVGYRESCEAFRLADHYMQTYYPDWYARYPVTLKQPETYFSFSEGGVFSWDTASAFSDPEGYRELSAEAVLRDLFTDNFSAAARTSSFSETELRQAAGFVSLSDAVPGILIEPRYHSEYNFVGERITGYEDPILLATKEAASALKAVNDELMRQGYTLKIYDAYRPARAVSRFAAWGSESDQRMKAFFYPDMEKSAIFAKGYVAKRSGHSRGSALDLTVCNASTGQELDMGGTFDLFGGVSAAGRTEGLSAEQIANRALLRTAMTGHGFKGISSEWWHFTLANEPWPDTYFDFPVNAVCIQQSKAYANAAAAPEGTPAEELPAEGDPEALTTEDLSAPLANAAEWLSGASAVSGVSQVMLVAGTEGSNAEFGLYEKNGAGQWTQVFTTPAYIGKNGMNDNRTQGDKTTPTGVFHYTMAFGIADDPGCPMGYTKVDETHYWAGNNDSPYYNTFVSTRDTTDFDPNDSEHLIDYTIPYQYCLDMGFNTERTPGRGSALFLHCYSKNSYTAGCVAIPQNYMAEVLRRLKPDTLIVIDTAARIRQRAGVP